MIRMAGELEALDVQDLVERARSMKADLITDNASEPDDQIDRSYFLAGYNSGVEDTLELFLDHMHEHVRSDIEEIQDEIDELSEEDLTDEQQEMLKRQQNRLEAKKKQMNMLQEVREESD